MNDEIDKKKSRSHRRQENKEACKGHVWLHIGAFQRLDDPLQQYLISYMVAAIFLLFPTLEVTVHLFLHTFSRSQTAKILTL